MKYANLQQARRLVEGFSPKERDLILPFLPTLPEQKTFDEILEDVYEAYMDEGDEANSDRLDEIHYQLENWIKITPARETAFFIEDYENLPEDSVVLGLGLPWIKEGNLWHNTRGEVRKSENMAGEPREVIRNGSSYVQ